MKKIKFSLSRTERGVKRSYAVDIVMYGLLLLFGIIMVIPFVFAISNALKPLSEFFYFPPRIRVENPTMDNFKDLFRLMSDSWVPFSRYIFNTVFITVVGTAGHIILSSMCAYALAKHNFPGKNWIFALIVTSLMFRGEVTTIPSFMIFSGLGLVDSYSSYILPALASTLGLYLMKQFMEQMVPGEILESARMDGAGEFYVFWKMAMPMVKPAWLTLMMLSVQSLWNLGSTSYIRSEELKTLNYALQQILTGGIARSGTAAAAMVLMMIVPIIIFIFSQSNILETMSTSGMKD